MKFRQGGAWERSRHWPILTDASHSSYPEQTALAFSLGLWACEDPLLGGWLHTVKSMTATQSEGRPLHHILVVAAVVCRVGLPAVLKVVGQHVVPAVLLL